MYLTFLEDLNYSENVYHLLQEFGNYDPWGKGAGQPLYDQLGNTMRFPQSHPAKGIPTVPARQPEIEDEGVSLID